MATANFSALTSSALAPSQKDVLHPPPDHVKFAPSTIARQLSMLYRQHHSSVPTSVEHPRTATFPCFTTPHWWHQLGVAVYYQRSGCQTFMRRYISLLYPLTCSVTSVWLRTVNTQIAKGPRAAAPPCFARLRVSTMGKRKIQHDPYKQ